MPQTKLDPVYLAKSATAALMEKSLMGALTLCTNVSSDPLPSRNKDVFDQMNDSCTWPNSLNLLLLNVVNMDENLIYYNFVPVILSCHCVLTIYHFVKAEIFFPY